MIPLVLCPEAARLVRGEVAEDRVFDLLTPERMPWWFIAARWSTEEEDRVGIDVVIYTRDVGRVLLQVKAGRTGASKFLRNGERRRGRRPRIHVLVAPPAEDIGIVFAALLGTLIRAREEAMAARTVADDPRLAEAAKAA